MSADKADSLCSKRVIPILTAVEKVPNGFAANFPPKDETRDDCSSICPHRWYQSEQKCSEQDRRLADCEGGLLSRQQPAHGAPSYHRDDARVRAMCRRLRDKLAL